jgi:hypothetical protein
MAAGQGKANENPISDVEELSKRAQRWYMEGFHQALSDRMGHSPDVQAEGENGILSELRSLIVQVIGFARLPLDVALAIFESVGLDEDGEDGLEAGSRGQGRRVLGRHVLGFGKVEISRGETRSITSISDALFRPDTLLVDPAMAPSFTIEDIQVESRSQFLSMEAVPAVAFSGTKPEEGLAMKMDPGRAIALIVKNISPEPRDFAAAIWGSLLG